MIDLDAKLAAMYERGRIAGYQAGQRAAGERLRAWAGCVRRLMAVAPTRAVIDETGAGFSGGGHSTPPERKAIREAAFKVVDGWLARDLAAALSEPAEAGEP